MTGKYFVHLLHLAFVMIQEMITKCTLENGICGANMEIIVNSEGYLCYASKRVRPPYDQLV
jgi:hypothetical protein